MSKKPNQRNLRQIKGARKKSLRSDFLDNRTNCLPVAGDSFQGAVVSTEGNVESDDSLASLDEVKVLLIDSSEGGSFIVEELDLLEETRLSISIKLWAELRSLSSEATED